VPRLYCGTPQGSAFIPQIVSGEIGVAVHLLPVALAETGSRLIKRPAGAFSPRRRATGNNVSLHELRAPDKSPPP